VSSIAVHPLPDNPPVFPTNTMGGHEHDEPIEAETEVGGLPTPETGEKKGGKKSKKKRSKKKSKKKKQGEEAGGSAGPSVAPVGRDVKGSPKEIEKEHVVVDSRQLQIETVEYETRVEGEELSEILSKSVEERVSVPAASRPISGPIGSSDAPVRVVAPDDLPAPSSSRPSSSQAPKPDVSFSPPNARRQSAPMEGKKIPGLPDIVGRPELSRWSSTRNDATTPSTLNDTSGAQPGSVPQTPSVLAEVRNLRSFGPSRTLEASGEPGDEDIDDGGLTRSQTWPPVDPSTAANSEIDIDDLARSTGQQDPSRPNTAESSQGQPGWGGKEGWASLYRIASQFKR